MPSRHMGSEDAGWPSEILRGWKEVARELRVSTRTAQRYEREFGLPIRRKAERFGTGVYALRKELSAWLEANPGVGAESHADDGSPASAAGAGRPTSRRTFVGVRSGSLLAAALAVVFMAVFVAYRRGSTQARLASWEIRENRLLALDSQGAVLWQRTFPFPIAHKTYEDFSSSSHPMVLVEDLDGDGPEELLFQVLYTAMEGVRGFYCFNEDGSERFSVDAERPFRPTVQFGERRFQSPFNPLIFRVGRDLQGRKSVFVASQIHSWFPAVVRKFSPTGQLEGEFWHAGHITRLSDLTVRGRRVLLAGAMNNEHISASLAVLD